MRSESVIQIIGSLLLLGAASLHAREIPVYREYTHAVQFYDDRGQVVTETSQGPDRVALQSLRDSKAQEVYLGKDTILDFGFKSGNSVFSSERTPVSMPAPAMGGGEETRRSRREPSGQNWLASSLSLPTLGQTASNAATATRSSGTEEPTGWGWLADEVSGQMDGDLPLPEDMRLEEEMNPIRAQESALTGSSDPYTPSASPMRDMEQPDSMASMGAFPDYDRAGSRPAEVDSYDPSTAASREWSSTRREEASSQKNYSALSPMSEQSQTRAMFSGWSVGARPDFSSVATVGTRQNTATMPSRMSSAYSSGMAGERSSGRWGHSTSTGVLPAGGRPSTGPSSWRGGWSANPVGSGRSSSFQQLSDPVLNPVVPNSSYERSRPSTSSGGYKPAWY